MIASGFPCKVPSSGTIHRITHPLGLCKPHKLFDRNHPKFGSIIINIVPVNIYYRSKPRIVDAAFLYEPYFGFLFVKFIACDDNDSESSNAYICSFITSALMGFPIDVRRLIKILKIVRPVSPDSCRSDHWFQDWGALRMRFGSCVLETESDIETSGYGLIDLIDLIGLDGNADVKPSIYSSLNKYNLSGDAAPDPLLVRQGHIRFCESSILGQVKLFRDCLTGLSPYQRLNSVISDSTMRSTIYRHPEKYVRA